MKVLKFDEFINEGAIGDIIKRATSDETRAEGEESDALEVRKALINNGIKCERPYLTNDNNLVYCKGKGKEVTVIKFKEGTKTDLKMYYGAYHDFKILPVDAICIIFCKGVRDKEFYSTKFDVIIEFRYFDEDKEYQVYLKYIMNNDYKFNSDNWIWGFGKDKKYAPDENEFIDKLKYLIASTINLDTEYNEAWFQSRKY